MPRSRYVHFYAAFGRQVLRAPWMYALMLERAQLVRAAAEALAPVGDPDSGWYGPDGKSGRAAPGTYAASFDVSVGTTLRAGRAGPRAFARVSNDSPHAAAVEYGFYRTPRYRVLGKSLGAAGGAARRDYST